MLAAAAPFLRGYIWQKQAFHLHLSCRHPAPWQKPPRPGKGKAAAAGARPCLSSRAWVDASGTGAACTVELEGGC